MNIAIILSGGTGIRIGGNTPKQYIKVNNKPIIADCLETFEMSENIDGYIIVASQEWEGTIYEHCGKKFKGFAMPGENRQLSIWNGLKKIESYMNSEDIIIIHDAARPFVSLNSISELIIACEDSDGAMPALPVKDTMYIQEDGKVKALTDRDSLIAGQAPEAFKYGKYFKANEKVLPDKILEIRGSTEPAFLAGMNIKVIPGDEKNFKITTKEDLDKYIQIKTGK